MQTDRSNATDRRRVLLGTAAAALVAASPARAESRPEAATTAGRIRGRSEGGICVFKGIRYGADTRPLRFRPPAPPKPWHGVREATAYGPACPQSARGEAAYSEDCLFLNVWTPALRDHGKRPVMVYIHGGAYANGSGSDPLYDGVNLCRRGNVVVVTINHRLNVFGYLSFGGPDGFGGETYADAGNAGQLDLVLALKWVRENISEFGGDPDCVLVFGQSGGGAKIATLMAMPAAKGLFHRAITMSGQQVTASGPLHAARRREAFLAKLGAHDIAALAGVSTERLVAALSATDPVIGAGGVYFGPVVDMRSLARHPFFPDAPGQSTDIPMMIGNTHDETRFFFRNEEIYRLSWQDLPARLAAEMRVDMLPEYVIARYRNWFPDSSPTDLFFRITTASRSWRGAIEEDEARARAGCPAYAYQLDWASPTDPRLGAPHTLDIALAFDNTGKPGALSGDGPEARRMAALLSETFIAFARTGKPDNPLCPPWRPYSLAERETMIFDLPPHPERDPRGRERALFAGVPFIQQGT